MAAIAAGSASAVPAEVGTAAAGHAGLRRVLGVGATAAALLVMLLLVRSRAALSQAILAVTDASAGWVLLTLAAVTCSFLAGTGAVVAAAGGRVTASRAALVEVAGAFCNRLGPASLGGSLLRIRYLTCAGLSVERAAASVAVIGVVGGLAQISGITLALLTGRHRMHLPMPGPRVLLMAMAGLVILLSTAALSRRRFSRARRRCAASGLELATQLRALAGDRPVLLRVIAGPILSSVARVLAFWAAAHAVGLGLGVGAAMLIYLAGTALAGAAPVPGGVGPAELTLTAGLTTVGAAPGLALAAVLTFRLASFWLPSVLGGGALLWLRHHGALSRPGQAAPGHRVAARASAIGATPRYAGRDSAAAGQLQTADISASGPDPHGGGRASETPTPTFTKEYPLCLPDSSSASRAWARFRRCC